MYDIAIIGAGPAGLSAALYSLRAGKKVIIFEGNKPGGLLNYIEKIENFPAFKSVSGKQLAKKMTEQVFRFNPTIIEENAAAVIESPIGGRFMVFTSREEYFAKKVIVCTGAKRAAHKAIEDFNGSGISFCATCDGFFYKDKTVAVLGDSAAKEDAEYLVPLCAKVYVIGSAEVQGAEVIKDDGLAEVLGVDSISGIRLKSGRVLDIDGLFVAMGQSAQNGVLDGISGITYPLKEGRIKNGLFIAGDAGAEFKQIVWAAASGARAASEALKERN